MEPNGAELGANKNALLGTAVILLTLAYLLSALYYVRWRRSIYLFNSLFLYGLLRINPLLVFDVMQHHADYMYIQCLFYIFHPRNV